MTPEHYCSSIPNMPAALTHIYVATGHIPENGVRR